MSEVAVPAAVTEQLARYQALVERYHGTLDLISPSGLAEFDRYLAEGMRYAALIERLAGQRPHVVDVGSGVGLPGVVIATALREATVYLVERRSRRAAFLELVVAQLGLTNARVVVGDVRNLNGVSADVVTAQAVAGLVDLVKLTDSVRAHPCWLVSRRGDGWRDGLGDVANALGQVVTPTGTSAENTLAIADVVEESLEPHGSLVAIKLPGGSACRSSA